MHKEIQMKKKTNTETVFWEGIIFNQQENVEDW